MIKRRDLLLGAAGALASAGLTAEAQAQGASKKGPFAIVGATWWR